LDKSAWAGDERFATNPARVAHRAVLIPQLEEIFRTRTADEWASRLSAANVPFSFVHDIPTALHSPQSQVRGMVQHVDHPQTGQVPLVGPVPKLSETPPQIRSAPPLLGEQTASILQSLLGYSTAQIRRLHDEGVI